MDILLVANSKYFIQILALLYSLFTYNSGEITVHFFYSDLSPAQAGLITRFVEQWDGKQIFWYFVDKETADGMKITSGYPEEIYYRIFAVNMLPSAVKKILYLDADVIVKGSLEELYETDLEGYAFAACEDIYGILSDAEAGRLEKLQIAPGYHYVNSGMLLLNLDYLREDCAVEKLTAYIKDAGEDINFPDQDALNVLYYNKIKYVPWEQYNCVPLTYAVDEESGRLLNYKEQHALVDRKGIEFLEKIDMTPYYYDNAVIVHYAGTRKPWVENQGDPYAVSVFAKAFLFFIVRVKEFMEAFS